ncbi:MAG: PorV/PorQ family protein [Candidatus Latescibacteria bacterium]|nr:PorV/PorQ family protein [bacterium]MBD3425031.1 PorV/PorQ family protein [Candidatus Latescibacterota bacterium]
MRDGKLIILLLTITALVAGGPAVAEEGAGGTRSVFLLGAGARSISMGGAFSAVGDDPSAIYYNPAALRLNRYRSVTVNHIQLFSGFTDANYDFIGMVYPTLSAGALGIGVMTTGTGGIREFNRYSVETGEISYRESQGILGYAFHLPFEYLGRFTAGASIKFLNQRIGDYSDNGAGMDLGLIYRQQYLEGLVLGCNLQDLIGAETKLRNRIDRLDRTLMLGAGYTGDLGRSVSFTASAQVDIPERADRDLRFGLECRIRNIIMIRLGYDSEQLTAGIGFSWSDYSADYGYFSREEAGSSHPVSVSMRFGKSIDERRTILNMERRREEEAYFRQVVTDRASQNMAEADSLMEAGELEEAYDKLKLVLEYDPSNQEAAAEITSLEERILQNQQSRMRSAEKQALIDYHLKAGLKFYRNNEYVQSREEWESLLELDPDNRQARNYLDKIRDKLDERIADYRAKARVYESDGMLAEALDMWNMIKVLDPQSEEAEKEYRRIKGNLRELSEDFEDTRKQLRVIDLFNRALNSFTAGNYSETVNLLDRVLSIDPQHREAARLIKRARRRLTPLNEQEKKRIRDLYVEGMKSFNQKKFRSAIELWEKILEIDPDNESVRQNIEEARRRLETIEQREGD